MNTVIFLGPSLASADARAILDADFRPPVSQGDVHRATVQGARIIGIIDGYFERVPAVWHKEILWALSRGVHVFGASSMGALRASELAPFGMIGVGRVFEAFRDGALEDDDEVTVVHGPAELGYKAVSEAMVNIRATLDRAESDGIIGAASHDALLQAAKDLYYPLRDYPHILEQVSASDLSAAERSALQQWLPSGRVDRKGLDAVELLRIIADFQTTSPDPFRCQFRFEHTDAWEQVARRLGHQEAAALRDDLPQEALLDELRLDSGAFGRAMTEALARALALREAGRIDTPVAREVFRDVLNGFFVGRGLTRPDEIGNWLAAQDLDGDGLTSLIMREVKIGQVDVMFRQEALAQLADVLRVAGSYGGLSRRAARKDRVLAFLQAPAVETTGLSEAELLHWHFVERRKEVVPADLERYSAMLGLPNRFSFLALLVREYLFVQSEEKQNMDAVADGSPLNR
ncbi:TfuA-related McrA-glycine thioamidation protein [Telmatospirillum sp.]|uniref:TfuA-related McrA-glycine thioamidation protein n=1 Tax=Telmatospirillum sp. TaxID=2079197 RepID=UPI00284F0C50|nr:TfuA-related McrA-glycine thioamidation protein [Telmatospirillum sp.]MDR3435528.1 TfuA-related McrA-glycine thioamidation protein [Telmatospirillum sp.]